MPPPPVSTWTAALMNECAVRKPPTLCPEKIAARCRWATNPSFTGVRKTQVQPGPAVSCHQNFSSFSLYSANNFSLWPVNIENRIGYYLTIPRHQISPAVIALILVITRQTCGGEKVGTLSAPIQRSPRVYCLSTFRAKPEAFVNVSRPVGH